MSDCQYGEGTAAQPCRECQFIPSRHCCYYDQGDEDGQMEHVGRWESSSAGAELGFVCGPDCAAQDGHMTSGAEPGQ